MACHPLHFHTQSVDDKILAEKTNKQTNVTFVRNTQHYFGKMWETACVIQLCSQPGAEHLRSPPSFNTILAPNLVGCELPVKAGGTRRAIWLHEPHEAGIRVRRDVTVPAPPRPLQKSTRKVSHLLPHCSGSEQKSLHSPGLTRDLRECQLMTSS